MAKLHPVPVPDVAKGLKGPQAGGEPGAPLQGGRHRADSDGVGPQKVPASAGSVPPTSRPRVPPKGRRKAGEPAPAPGLAPLADVLLPWRAPNAPSQRSYSRPKQAPVA